MSMVAIHKWVWTDVPIHQWARTAAAGSYSGARTWWLQGGIGAKSLMIAPTQHHHGNELFLVSKDCIV
jgi:hypothetical protein